MTELGKYDLPKGWRWATIPELVGSDGVFIDGDWVESKDQDPEGDVRLIQLADVGDGFYRNRSDRFMTKAKADELRCTYLQSGDILIARMPDPLGRACIFPGDEKLSVTVVDVAIVRSAKEEFDHRWLMHFINAHPVRAAISGLQAGSTRKRVSRGNLGTIPLPVPPLHEQRRIVAEIEQQFTRLDAGVAALHRTQANLKRYRAAVLKAACEGRLVPTEAELARENARVLGSIPTGDFDSANQHERPKVHGSTPLGSTNFETGKALLARILTERRQNWQGRGKYKEPEAPNAAHVSALPNGWIWTNIGQVAEVGTGATPNRGKKEYYTGGKIPWVTSGCVNSPRVDKADQFVTSSALDQCNLTIYQPGTLILAMYGEGKTRGMAAELGLSATTNQALAAIQTPETIRGFIKVVLWKTYEDIRKSASGGVQPNLNLSIVRAIPVPLPPLVEQTRIVAEVDRRLSVVNELESVVKANLQRTTRLRQSILQQSFPLPK